MGASDLNSIGQSIRRKEDYRFLIGAGQYTDDVNPPHHTHVFFLRSPHAHAKLGKIDTAKAKAAPGVLAIYTGADMTGVNGLPCGWLITGSDGQPMKEPPHPVLAQGKVRYVGDPVAMVIAETPGAGEGCRRADRGRLRRSAGGCATGRRAAGRLHRRSMRARRATSATPGSWATRLRSRPRSPRRRT